MPINKKKIPEINGGSLSDISFLMLTFFLLTTTMDTDRGLARMLPPIVEQDDFTIEVKERNVLPVLINYRNEIAVKGERIHISQLKDITVEFLENKYDLEKLPERFDTEIEFFGVIPITKNAVISLQSDRGAQYQVYLNVQNELQAAYNELRNQKAKERFKMPYDDLNDDQQKAIRTIFTQRISEAEPRSVKK